MSPESGTQKQQEQVGSGSLTDSQDAAMAALWLRWSSRPVAAHLQAAHKWPGASRPGSYKRCLEVTNGQKLDC